MKNKKNGQYKPVKRLFTAVLAIVFLVLFTGCIYMEQDIKNITVVQGIGVDYDPVKKEYKLAVEVFDIAQSSGMGESESGNLTKVLKVSGDTVSSAINKVTLEIGKTIVFSHNKVIVLGESALEQGVAPVMDFFLREYRNRSNVSVVVAMESTAAEVIEANQGDVSFPARELETLLESGRINGYTTNVTVSDLTEMEEDDHSATYIPMVKIRKEGKSEYTTLDGFMVLKKGKPVGTLSLNDARGLLFIIDEVSGGVFNVEDEELGLSSLKIVSNNTKIETNVDSGARFTVNIDCVADILEISEKNNIKLNEEDSKRLEKLCAKHIEEIIKKTLVTCLDEYNADVFGFTRRVWIFYPGYYRENEENIRGKLGSEDVTVNVKFEVRRTGQGNA